MSVDALHDLEPQIVRMGEAAQPRWMIAASADASGEISGEREAAQ